MHAQVVAAVQEERAPVAAEVLHRAGGRLIAHGSIIVAEPAEGDGGAVSGNT